MKINHLAHASFRASDFEKSLYFYEECLGLERAFVITMGEFGPQLIPEGLSPEEEATLRAEFEARKDEIGIVYLKVAPGQFIEVFPGDPLLDKVKTGDRNGYLHLCLEVDDVKAWREHLIAKGANVTTDISLGCDNAYQFWMKDPDGNEIEMMQYLPNAYQLVGK